MASQQLNALKSINTIQRDGSLQNLLLSIKQVKAHIDSFSKALQDQKRKLQALQREKERQAELEMKAEEKLKAEAAENVAKTEVKQEEKPKKQIFSQGTNQNNNFRKFEGNNAKF